MCLTLSDKWTGDVEHTALCQPSPEHREHSDHEVGLARERRAEAEARAEEAEGGEHESEAEAELPESELGSPA